jgi:DNA-binding IclR family transcriptional regulator
MQSVDRVSGVLLAFTDGHPVLGVTDIARELDLPKSAVHRTLSALVVTGLLSRDGDTARYRLGPRAVDLGLAAGGSPDLLARALPFLQELRDRSGETATLSALIGVERVYLGQVEGAQDVRMTIEVGARAVLYAGASGRAILAQFSAPELESYLARTTLSPLTESTITDGTRLRRVLQEVRDRGYAASRGERDASAGAVAAGFRVGVAGPIGSMSICGPLQRFTGAAVSTYGGLVAAAAARLSAQQA